MNVKHIGAEIEFDDGSYLFHDHRQECYEQVYADFPAMVAMVDGKENSIDITKLDFFENIMDSIVPIDGLGFYIVTKQGICLLVSCYDNQNGFYSSKLTLRHEDADGRTIAEKDISKCCHHGSEE